MANSNWVDELKMRCNIVSVASNYISLNKKGKNHWGNCPFHSEKTPSFTVNEEGQFYKCFGCGVSGDVIKFIEEIENISFIEACRFLADKVNFEIPNINKDETISKEYAKKDQMLTLMREAGVHYYKNLYKEEGKQASSYILNRGISKETIKKFGLGASIDNYSLINYLKEKGFSLDLIMACGVAQEKNGKVVDALFKRLIIPIFNSFGQIIAFGGRDLEKTTFAKYKNTCDTQLFHKGNVLYGIQLMKEYKANNKLNNIIVVEGYMDVMGLYDKGIKNVVASMGTAFTETQARLLKRYVDDVYVSFDGDAAGQGATLRSLDILYKNGLNVKVVCIVDGKDPDEYVAKHGKEGYLKLLEDATPLFDYKINILKNKFDLSTSEGKGRFATEALKELEIITNSVEMEPYIQKISKIASINEDVIRENKKNISIETATNIQNSIKKERDGKYDFVLYSYISKKTFAKFDEDISIYIQDEKYLKIYKTILQCYSDNINFDKGLLYDRLYNERELYEKIMQLEYADITINEEKYFFECKKRLRFEYLEEKKKKIAQDITVERDSEARKKLLVELNSTTIELNNLKNTTK